MGGPGTLDDVEPFLVNLFSDRDIIELPMGALLQPVVARLIAKARGNGVRRNYASIGGGSPQLRLTRAQALALNDRLDRDTGRRHIVEVAMRYWQPDTETALRAPGVGGRLAARHAHALPALLARHHRLVAARARPRARAAASGRAGSRCSHVEAYPDHPLYLDAMADTVRRALAGFPAHRRDHVTILFSAHGLPQKFVDEGDPYVEHTHRTVQGILDRLAVPNPHAIGFQSRTGPVTWIGPGTEDVLRDLGRRGVKEVLMVPVSFVSDHIETLYEVDQLFKDDALASGIVDYRRSEALNTHPLYIEALADLVGRQLDARHEPGHRGGLVTPARRIVGGGIAGLSVAHALLAAGRRRHGLDVTVLERGDAAGRQHPHRVRRRLHSASGARTAFSTTSRRRSRSSRTLGLEARLQPSDERARTPLHLPRGPTAPLPGGPVAFLGSGLLSWSGKIRIALEPFARRRPEGDETIHAFATRRIGREAADVLIDSMVSGVFGGDARALSLRACFPKMWQMETDHGGLFRALLARRRQHPRRNGEAIGSPLGRLTSFRGGSEELVRGLVARLGDIVRTGVDVRARAARRPGLPDRDRRAVAPAGRRGGARERRGGDGADGARRSMRHSPRPWTTIPTAGMVVVCLGYARTSAARAARRLRLPGAARRRAAHARRAVGLVGLSRACAPRPRAACA